MAEPERWLPGDVVLAGDGEILRRVEDHDAGPPRPWQLFGDCCDVYGQTEDFPVRPLTLLVRGGKPVTDRVCTRCGGGSHELGMVPGMVGRIRTLLLADGGQFDDDHTYDAHRLARIAELIGLHVVYAPCDGCSNKSIPQRIQVGSDG